MSRSPVVVPEVSALQLAQQLHSGECLQVLDVRLPARVANGRIDLAPPERFHNLVGSQVLARNTLDGTGIGRRDPIVVVCGHGNDSKVIAEHLNGLGYRAASLRGGMAAWMEIVLPRPLAPTPSLDQFVQFDRPGKGSLAYLLVSDGEALVVDPPRDASRLLDAAHDAGARIVGVADTHLHADYISGAHWLSRELGVPYYLHPSDVVYPYDGSRGAVEFEPIADGDSIRVGRCALQVMHTPGHTEGSVCYLIDGLAALTGDFVFVNAIGRPDLAGRTEEWTRLLWGSVQAAKRLWPEELTIYPAHYDVNARRRADGAMADSFASVIERTEAFQAPGLDAFARWVSARAGSFPDAYRRIKAVNLGLDIVDDRTAEELEVGRNQCAL